MKLATHISTALLTSLFFVNTTEADNPVLLAMLFASIYISQVGIDAFGHKWVTIRGQRFPKRNKLHSLPGVLAWGLLFGSPFLLSNPVFTLAVVAGMLVHYLEDAVTEGGVYLFSNKRKRLPFRIKYDDPIVNRATILVFIVATSPVAVKLLSSGGWVSLYSLAVLFYSVGAFLYV